MRSSAPARRPAELLDALDGLHARAAAEEGASTTSVAIAGRRVALTFAGDRLCAALTRAFRHLPAPAGGEVRSSLSVRVWDGARHRPPATQDRADRWRPGSTDAFGPSYYGSSAGVQLLHQPTSAAFSAFDAATGRAWYWVADADRVPFWDRAAPLRHVLGWYLASEGLEQVHGGAVGTQGGGGVLLVGKSGSGKSTTTLAAAVHGRLAYAGDDYVAVEPATTPLVHSLFCSAKLEPDHLRRFPELLPPDVEPPVDGEKAVAYLGDGTATAAGFQLRALIVPRLTGGTRPILRPVAAGAALSALAPSTILQVHPPRQEALARLARLVRTTPCFELELGGDLVAVGRAVAGLLEEAGAS